MRKMNSLDLLKKYTIVVADTGDIASMKQYVPTDATTNPSLIFKAAQKSEYKHLIEDAVKYGKSKSHDDEQLSRNVLDKLAVDPMVRNFMFLLIDRKRVDQLPGIETAFNGLVDDIRGITRAQVTSAQPLSETELGQVTEALSKISGKQVIVTTEVEPTYIGGLAAKVGDMVFDGTIRTQLNQLKESLKG